MKDQLHREIYLKSIPKRIVSLVPSQTELIVDLGLEKELVGVTKFCIHPKQLRQDKTIVGGTKHVHFQKIKALEPDIILCNKEENTKEMILELEPIAPVHISDIYSVNDSLELISMYGEIFGINESAQTIINDIKSKHDTFKSVIAKQPKVRVAYFIWKSPYMVAASQTFINEIIQINNFENVFQDLNRYPEIKLSELKDKNLDLILLSSEPYPFKDIDFELFKPECPEAKIMIVDGKAFSWYGSRLSKAFDYFTELRKEI